MGRSSARPDWCLPAAAMAVVVALFWPPAAPLAQQKWVHRNPVVEKLAEGKHVFGVSTSDLSPENARSLAREPNIDYVYLDMEHNPLRFDQMETFISAMTRARRGGATGRADPHRP